MDNVKVFKFVTGEEIVASILGEDSEEVELKDPVMLVMQPNKEGGIGVGILPYAASIDGSISVNKNKILYSGKPTEELLNTYESIFSKVKVVSKPSLLVPK